MRRLMGWLVGIGLWAGCSSPELPRVSAKMLPPPSASVSAATPEENPLEQARQLFEAGRYADAAALARQLPGRESGELHAVALLACGRELQAMAAYAELARSFPEQPEYARVHQALHNGWMIKRADNYLARAGLAFNAGRRPEAARLANAALDALYSQQGCSPDAQRLKLARQLLALAQPQSTSAPAPPAVQVRVLPARPQVVQSAPAPAYPRAAPRALRPRSRPGVRPVEVAVAPAWAPPVPRPTPAPYYRPARPALSAVAQRRSSESLLHHYGASMQPYSGGGHSWSGGSVTPHY